MTHKEALAAVKSELHGTGILVRSIDRFMNSVGETATHRLTVVYANCLTDQKDDRDLIAVDVYHRHTFCGALLGRRNGDTWKWHSIDFESGFDELDRCALWLAAHRPE